MQTGKTAVPHGRIAFLEVLPADPFRVYRSHVFPFLAGHARSLGGETLWLSAGVPLARDAAGSNTYVYALTAGDLRLILERLQGFAPTHLLINERLREEDWAGLRAGLPGTRVLLNTSVDDPFSLLHLCAWLGLETGTLRDDRPFQEQVEPVYHREAVNAEATSVRHFVPLLAGLPCLYVHPVERNPAFRGVPLAPPVIRTGCSFCGAVNHPALRLQGDVVEVALRQLLAAERTLPEAFRTREYLVRGADLLHEVERFFQALFDAGVPPSGFWFNCRLDELLRLEEPLRRILPEVSRRGFRIHLWSMGIENFSPAENERFNKGLAPDTVIRGIGVLRELHRAFPEALHPPKDEQFATILFTPWTTVDDLRRNIAAYRTLGLPFCEIFLGRRLELMPDRAITALAQRDGLLDAGGLDPGLAGCRTFWNVRELPWRFRDPLVARIFWIARRMISVGFMLPGEDGGDLVRAWRSGLPERCRGVLDVFEALVESVAGAPEDPLLLHVLRRAEAHLGVRSSLDLDPFLGEDEAAAVTSLREHLRQRGLRDEQVTARWQAVADRARGFLEDPRSRLPEGLRGLVLRLRRGDAGGLELLSSGEVGAGLRILVEDHRPDRRCFLSEGGLALSHASGSRAPAPEESAGLRALLRACAGAAPGSA